MDQFWFMKLPAWMWIKLTQKTLISMDLKCWLWYITYFCSSLLEIDEKPKTQEKIKVTFFLFTIFAHISQSYSCTFFEIHQILQKNVKLAGASQHHRRQLKSSIYEYLDLIYVISLKIISISKLIWSSNQLFPVIPSVKVHLI